MYFPMTDREHYAYLKEFVKWLESHWDLVYSDTSFEQMENQFKEYYEKQLAEEEAIAAHDKKWGEN